MKSFKRSVLFGLMAFGFLLLAKPGHADGLKYYAALSTVPVNGTVSEFTANYPNISTTTAANLYVRKIIITNSTSTVAQTISVYDTCTSTSAASLKLKTYLGAASQVVQAVQEFDFLPRSFKLSGACFNKSSVTSDVNLTVFYE